MNGRRLPAAGLPALTLAVGELVALLRSLIEEDPRLARVGVVGELSGVKQHTSGHWYFLLKDARAQLRAVLFRREAARLSFRPRDGQMVVAWGRVGVFERDGQTQLYVDALEPLGEGAAFLELEALKRRLEAEGLFNRPKRPLPLLPRAVGVVTSAAGAAIADIRTVIGRRYPGMPVVLRPVLVQGEGAPAAIAEAVRWFSQAPEAARVDVLIVGRGGGSREDLMAFNREEVVRAVAESRIPVIAAVGHEIDSTLTDLAADVRAPTPSAAAELAVPERARLEALVEGLAARARRALERRLAADRRHWQAWAGHGLLRRPARLLEARLLQLERLTERGRQALERRLERERARLERVRSVLMALDPARVLARGYAVVREADSGRPVGARQIRTGAWYRVEWVDGGRAMQAGPPEEGNE
ncbi:Exodeoxyribonuclease 7 large subunit [Candidatus Hydrogenisulfobacillus filiaventi]|uniref:Exodeoxyribonuclease 7 large subunit n=1 Tax=Candidatus Hydrogenisulfobacillus filiaventi TaxID=2707344 RepID=A0A6F8ZGC8_9FIRM|nr:exodeoxyribonuclease VII large subunit [Bacillota bacterium]CAB1128652.1 Exodeoxyribonuclease 7 large subunit [Candidatus Hydrogenisulfobacillus filiaventi]